MQFLTMMILGLMVTSGMGQTLSLTLGSTVQTTQAPIHNIIANSDFSSCTCQTNTCPVNSNTILTNWTPDCSSIEVGYGYLYNNLLSNERVVAPSKNTCIKQQLCNLHPGYYQLAIQYTALQNQQLNNCQFGVSLNGVILQTIAPVDYTVQTQLIDVKVANGCAPVIKVCGLGADEGSYGAIIKSVNLIENLNTSFGVNFNPIVIDVPAVTNTQTINVGVPNVNLIPIQSPSINVATPTLNVQAIQAPNINVAAPQINVPNIQAPNINVAAPQINVPVLQPPTVNVATPTLNVQAIPTPNINVAAPIINVPQQPSINLSTPPINVAVPQPPTVNVATPIINVPNIQAPNINLQTPTINVPVLQPPTVNVATPALNVQAIPTPNINVAAPTLNLQTIQTPNINFQPSTINVPVAQPPSINFQTPIINVGTSNAPGIYIDSTSSQSYQRQYQFQGGDIVISFTFNVLTTAQLVNSALFITIDNQQVYKVLASRAGQTITVTVPQLSAGVHVIGLAPFGCSTQPAFTFYIPNFTVQQKICSAQWGSDLITNGGFQTNTCQGSWCIWNQNNFQTSYISGWTPNPEIEIGTGSIYNSAWGTQQVSELDASQNTCINQQLILKAGTYNLKFDWAARAGTSFATNGLQVSYNGQVIKTISPCDYNIHTESIQFTLNSTPTSGSLQFCGTGTSDGSGTAISNIKLFYYNTCGNYTLSTC